MDSITQGLLGGVVAQLGFRQRIGRDATWVAVGAAILPDLDIVIAPLMSLAGLETGPLDRIVVHRSYSHSLLVAPLLALPVTLAWWGIRRRRGRRNAGFGLLFLLILLALLTQPLLDVCTSYGTQILLPLDSHRYALDAVPIVDIFYTPALILTLLGCWLLRRTMGEARSRRPTLIVGAVGMILSTAYLGAGLLARQEALSRGRAALAGQPVERLEAYPMIPTILLWRVVSRLPDRWEVMRVHVLGQGVRARRVERRRGPWRRQLDALDEVRTFRWFADGLTRPVATPTPDGGVRLVIHDMRYAMTPDGVDSLWTLRLELSAEGRASEVSFDRSTERRGQMGAFVRRIWQETWTPAPPAN